MNELSNEFAKFRALRTPVPRASRAFVIPVPSCFLNSRALVPFQVPCSRAFFKSRALVPFDFPCSHFC